LGTIFPRTDANFLVRQGLQWVVFATRRKILSVCLMPEAEVNPGIFNVGYWES
jgi:hypothetical protein